MKVLYRISLLLNLVFGCYILVKGAELLSVDYFSPKTQIEAEETDDSKETESTLEQNNTNIEVVAQEETTDCDTTYSVTEYDRLTENETTHEELIPAAYIGKSRSEIEELIKNYCMAPSLSDQEKGFIAMKLTSFSSEEINVKKVYEIDNQPLTYCMVAEDGLLTVYDGTCTTVYLYTDISLYDLPEDLQQEILDKKYFDSEEEMYNFLESYSS